jgi:hypothetical protein
MPTDPKPRPRRQQLIDALDAIERIAGDDFCEELEMSHFLTRKFRGEKRVMFEKLAAIYRLAHGASPSHSCYNAHDSWRKELSELTAARRREEPRDAD